MFFVYIGIAANRSNRWKPFDPSRNWPDLGPQFIAGEKMARKKLFEASVNASLGTTAPGEPRPPITEENYMAEPELENDKRDLDWSTALKRTFEAYIRGERPNMYGEWIKW